MKKLLLKLILLLLVFSMFFSTFSYVCAESYTIQAAERDISEYYVKIKWHDGSWVFPFARYTYYIKDGIEYPAYCVNEHLDGAYEHGNYDVVADTVTTNSKIWRAIKMGYGFRTPQEMGLDTPDQAYLATRFAIYCIVAGDDVAVDDRYLANDETGIKIISAMKEIVDYARNSTDDTYTYPTVSIQKSGDPFYESIDDINYVSQNYILSANVPILSYSIRTENLPENTRFSQSSNNFKISIPTEDIPIKISGTIFVENIKLKSYPIVVGQSPSADLQNYALVTKSFEIKNTQTDFFLENYATIKISKYSSDHNYILELPEGTPLPNTTFSIERKDGTLVGTYITDSNGHIQIDNLPLGTYIITEVNSPEYFIKCSEPHLVTLSKHNDCVESIFTNEPEKIGTIKILKYSDGYSSVLDLPSGSPLSSAEFSIAKEDGTIIGTFITDKDGIALATNLPLGTYIITETKSPKYFLQNTEPKTVTISNNGECIELIFTNIPDNPKLPKTGF